MHSTRGRIGPSKGRRARDCMIPMPCPSWERLVAACLPRDHRHPIPDGTQDQDVVQHEISRTTPLTLSSKFSPIPTLTKQPLGYIVLRSRLLVIFSDGVYRKSTKDQRSPYSTDHKQRVQAHPCLKSKVASSTPPPKTEDAVWKTDNAAQIRRANARRNGKLLRRGGKA